ncbi:MAG: DUF1365 domain-containing protein [Acidobacteria bacterium]|nr:DUF1365 domain-containing protein [Acidobacteriota bacterium]
MTALARHSALYVGKLRHRRFAPHPHAFEYRLFLTYLDLAELDSVFEGRWFWSARRRNLAWLDRRDHLGDPAVPLDTAVRDLVGARTGRRPEGPIRLLTHLRTFGHCFNPVSLYYCFDAAGRRVDALVAEVNNTPWGEQYCYVLDGRDAEAAGAGLCYRAEKRFHVSPFLGMDMDYVWNTTVPSAQLALHIENRSEGVKVFDATLRLERWEITGLRLAWALARFPLLTVRVVAWIHWEALRLWLKKTPFHPHPGRPLS